MTTSEVRGTHLRARAAFDSSGEGFPFATSFGPGWRFTVRFHLQFTTSSHGIWPGTETITGKDGSAVSSFFPPYLAGAAASTASVTKMAASTDVAVAAVAHVAATAAVADVATALVIVSATAVAASATQYF